MTIVEEYTIAGYCAIQILLKERGQIDYLTVVFGQFFPQDLLCYGVIFVELMATERLPDEAEAVMINDMQATGMHIGLMINFGSADKLQWKQLKA